MDSIVLSSHDEDPFRRFSQELGSPRPLEYSNGQVALIWTKVSECRGFRSRPLVGYFGGLVTSTYKLGRTPENTFNGWDEPP